MINVIFVGEKIYFWKNLLNKINFTTNNIRVCSIVNNIDEMIHIIKDINFDIILIDLEKIKYSEIENNSQIEKYKESIILLLNNKDLKKLKDIKYNYALKFDISNIIKTINKIYILQENSILVNKEKDIKNKIEFELAKIGYNFNHLGTIYLLETIYIIYISGKHYDFNLEKDIYPIISEKYGKKTHNIKCNIRNATDIMYYENEEDKIKDYFKDRNFSKPITTKKVILSILAKMR